MDSADAEVPHARRHKQVKFDSQSFGNEYAVLIDGSKRQCQVSNVRHGFEAVEQGP